MPNLEPDHASEGDRHAELDSTGGANAQGQEKERGKGKTGVPLAWWDTYLVSGD